ncbi:hypothetical protein BAY61_32465 (plasmid) [Prauserella marina]|uniref:Uncharacterized protein n=1 Tax=Prauserella marina TaxID=530584 RepID=A0A222W1B8_9PSEU|nr:hypothetical protein [Prauserella marina]ASR39996.1 hypothetical protein BAY61_32465 [Prauserella marina]PWV71338.1 hypothetical protein DES30_11254 [Prauserella marina]SDD96267.1 hypothetical protein SAMN05421630_11558 [Prauserella marina]
MSDNDDLDGYLRAGDLPSGITVRNPAGQQPWLLDLLAVHGPDAEQMVTLAAVQGTVRVAADWPVALYTAADADLESCLLLDEEQDRRRT